MSERSVPDAAAIVRQKLGNGLAVLIYENHASPSLVVNGYLRGGSMLETPAQSGLASFAATMMRRGAGQRSFAQINEDLEAVGASFGVSGGCHVTNFGGKCLSEDAPLLFEVMADILRSPSFPAAQVEKVRGQTLTSLQERDNDTRSMASLTFERLLYGPEHPYGRSLSGERETVSALTRDDLANFYRSVYGPRQGAIVIVGDVQAAAVLQRIEALLGDWDHPPVTATLPPAAPLASVARSEVVIGGKTQSDVVLGWLGPSRSDPDYYAAALTNTILGRFGMMGRLGENVRERQGLAYYAYSAIETGEGPGSWMVIAGVNPANVGRTIASALVETTRLLEELISDEEVADSKAFMTGILPLRLETNQGVAETIADMERFDLGLDFLKQYPDLINQLTAPQLQAAAQRFIDPARYALGIAGPPLS